jgi:hypothetical protein
MPLIFSTAYLPPAAYFFRLAKENAVLIDGHEHFIKQSYRSRCIIYGPNGKQDLIVPVVHQDLQTKPISEVRISYSERWQSIHWRSILAAYRNSPFFEYYEDDFKPFFENEYEFLFDFNLELLKLILKLKKVKTEILLTDKFEKTYADGFDLRNHYSPKNEFEQTASYHQVFADRHGFIDRLSVIDYLFNVR